MGTAVRIGSLTPGSPYRQLTASSNTAGPRPVNNCGRVGTEWTGEKRFAQPPVFPQLMPTQPSRFCYHFLLLRGRRPSPPRTSLLPYYPGLASPTTIVLCPSLPVSALRARIRNDSGLWVPSAQSRVWHTIVAQ